MIIIILIISMIIIVIVVIMIVIMMIIIQELGLQDHDYYGFWGLSPLKIWYLDPLGVTPWHHRAMAPALARSQMAGRSSCLARSMAVGPGVGLSVPLVVWEAKSKVGTVADGS